MKRLSLIILLGALCAGSFAQPKGVSDLQKMKLKGPVRSVMEWKFLMADTSLSMLSDSLMHQKYTQFDPNGYEMEWKQFENGSVSRYAENIFGNNEKQSVQRQYNPDGSLYCEITYSYDKREFILEANYDWVEQRGYEENLIKNDFVFVIFEFYPYNKVLYENEYRGYVTREEFVQAGDRLFYTYEHRYDARGNKISMTYFNASGHTSWVTKYKYDRYDNLIASSVFKNSYIALETEYDYQFDEAGNWISRREKRKVYRNILTQSILDGNILTEREITYY